MFAITTAANVENSQNVTGIFFWTLFLKRMKFFFFPIPQLLPLKGIFLPIAGNEV